MKTITLLIVLAFYLGGELSAEIKLPHSSQVSPSLPTSKPNHDFHVSKCLMNYRPEQQTLQISMHIFLDDLELALSQRGHSKLFLCTQEEAAGADTLVEAYLRDKFQLTLNGQPRDFNFVGKEISDDLAAVWCYMEVTNLTALKSLQLRYSVLMDIYKDQKNLASLERPGAEIGTLLFQKGNEVKQASF